MRLTEVAIRRPVFALMLVLAGVTLGLLSLGRIEMQLDPDTDHPFVVVTTELRGASPETVESEITDVLEEHVNAVEGIRVLSSSSTEGLSDIFIQFELGADAAEKVQEVRNKVALARPFLPLDVEDSIVSRYDIDELPILTVMLSGRIPLRDLSDFAEQTVSERLERLPGVGNVTPVGAREREIRIWVDPVRLTGYGLAVQEVADVLRRENTELAGGRVEGAEREWSVTTQGKVSKPEDFAALIVAERAGRLVRLGDVAVVEDGLAEQHTLARMDGETAVSLEVRVQGGANVVEVAREVKRAVADMAPILPAGLEMRVAKDASIFIEESVRSVLVDMLYAGVLVVAVVLFFLRDRRATAIASIAIPASIISAFAFIYGAGFTLNSMTLTALSLSIGLVIDDAIVVIESIFRRLERGENAAHASQRGAEDVGLAVVSTTLAVCGVFVPIAFMRGMIGVYFYEFGLVVVFAVCVSTLVAVTAVPMIASRVLTATPRPGRWLRRAEALQRRMDRGYAAVLAAALRRKRVTVAVAVVSIAGGCGIASTVPFDIYVESDMGEFVASFELPIGTPLPVTDRALRAAESALADHPLVNSVYATAGHPVFHRPHQASLYLSSVPKNERDKGAEEIFDELRERLAPVLPTAEQISLAHFNPFIGDGLNSKDLEYSLLGPDLGRLERYAESLVARMQEHAGFVDVDSSYESGKPEISLHVERDRAADLGVPAVEVGRSLRTLLAGEKVGSYEESGRRYDVRVQILPEYRDDPGKLDLIRVRSLRGQLVPLSNVVRRSVGEGPVDIRRENRARAITVRANMADGFALGTATQLIEAWALELGVGPPDEFFPGSTARTMDETGREMVFSFFLALVAIYMVLASLFNSLAQPLTIMMSAPLSFIGGFLALKLSGYPLEMMSMVGLLVLMGLVMKNGILLVDYIGELRRRGLGRDEAILEAGPVRMRPVLMTSAALIFGMLPAVLSDGAGSEYRAPMAIITIGGLLTSTLLTLVVVPVTYVLVDSASAGVSAAGRWAVTRMRRRDAATPALRDEM